MIANGDSIKFESRVEVGYTLQALEDWLSFSECDDDKRDVVKRIVECLDYMEMCW